MVGLKAGYFKWHHAIGYKYMWGGGGERSWDRPGDTVMRMHYTVFSSAGEPNVLCGLLTVLYLCIRYFHNKCISFCVCFLFPQGSSLTGQSVITLLKTFLASTYLIICLVISNG